MAAEVERLSDEYEYWLNEAEDRPEESEKIAVDILNVLGYDVELVPRIKPRVMPSDVGHDPSA